MSDAAFRSKGSSASAEVPAMAEQFVPRASGLPGGNRMSGVESEREAAASQMQRSLRAWRKAKDEEVAEPAFVPPSGGGRPLPGDVRKRMEPKLGADLSTVRMHEGGEAAANANKLGARAFTVGSDVHFNAGEFNPGTKEGDRLIAHELTHVVQGQKSGVQRKPEEGEEKKDEKGGAEVSTPEEPAEKEADAKGDAVADELHEGGDKDEKKDEKGKDGKDKDKKKDKGKDKGGKHAKDAANDEDEEKKKGGEGAEAAGGDEKKDEKKDDVKEPAPATAAKLKVFRVKSKEDKQKEIAERKKLLTAKVELAAKAAERVQKIGELVASIGIDALATLAGPAYPAIAPILKELVPSTVSVLADTKREIDTAVLTKAIQSMTNSQLKKLGNSLQTKEPTLGDFKEAVGKRTFDLEAAAMAGGALNYAKEGLKNVGKEGAKKGLLEVLKHIAEKIVPLADAAIALKEIISLSSEMSTLRGEIEELEKAV